MALRLSHEWRQPPRCLGSTAPLGWRRPVVSMTTSRFRVTNPPPFLFADKQRLGIREYFGGCLDISDHARRALQGRFPLAQETPLPRELKRAADFVIDSDPRVVAAFRSALASGLAGHQRQWGSSILPAIQPAAGKIRPLPLRHLADQCGLGGSRRLGKFSVGFPITGELSQNRFFSAASPSGVTIEQGKMFGTDAARFSERSATSGMKTADQLRGEAIGKVEKGWLRPPATLGAAGFPDGFRPVGYNIAFRLGAEQAAKLRARDDLKHILANSARTIRTPMQLVLRGHFPQMFRRLRGSGRDWSLFKADHEDAYKKLPLCPRDQALAVIAHRRPKSGKWFGFVSRTLVFGAAAAVIRYNGFSRLVTAFVNRMLGIPLICFSKILRLRPPGFWSRKPYRYSRPSDPCWLSN